MSTRDVFVGVAAAAAAGFVLHRAAWAPIDALARTMLAEAGDIRPDTPEHLAEWHAIGYVARNRSEQWNAPIRAVVTSKVPGRPVWNASDKFRRDWEQADEHQDYLRALLEAARVLTGLARNPIGDRTGFWHPQGMVPVGRVPDWAQGRESAWVVVGRATFV